MRKELLLSLVAAGAVPAAALADIDVTTVAGINNATQWANNGLGSVDYQTGSLLKDQSIVVTGASAGNLTCPIAAGTLPVGTYKIQGTGENLKLSVKVGDGAYVENAEGFTLTSESAVTVKIEGAAPSTFSLTGLTLSIEVDFATYKAEILKKSGYVSGTASSTIKIEESVLTTISAENQGDGHKYAEGLQANENALKSRIATLNTHLALLNSETLENYKSAVLGLHSNPITIYNEVTTLAADITAHNSNVAAKNTASAIYKANQAYKSTQSDIAAGYNTIVRAITVGEDKVWNATSAAVSAFDSAYAAYQTELGKLDSDTRDYTTGTGAVKTAAATLEALKTAAVNADTEAKADIAAYDLIQNTKTGYIVDINAKAAKLYNYFMGLHGTYGSEQADKMATLKKAVLDVLENRDILDAHENQAADKALYDALVDETTPGNVAKSMFALKYATEAHVLASEAAYTKQTGTTSAEDLTNGEHKGLGNVISELDAAKVLVEALSDLNSDKAGLINECNSIGADTLAAKQYADRMLVNYENVEKSIDSQIDAIEARIQALTTPITGKIALAQAKQADWKKNDDAIKKYSTTLGQAQKDLERVNGELKSVLAKNEEALGKVEIDLVKQYSVAYKSLTDAIETATDNNNSNLSKGTSLLVDTAFISKGVQQYVEKASPTAADFQTVLSAYSKLNEDFGVLQTLVNGAEIITETKKVTWTTGYITTETHTETVMDMDLSNQQVQYTSVACGPHGTLNKAPNKAYYTDGIEASIKKVLAGITNAAGQNADKVYETIHNWVTENGGANLNPDKVKETIKNNYTTFVNALIDGNAAALKAKAEAYNDKYTAATAADTYGPGLDDAGKKGIKNLKATLADYQAKYKNIQADAEKAWDGASNGEWKKMITSASQIEAPATCLNDSWGDQYATKDKLIDGDNNSFWHSDYNSPGRYESPFTAEQHYVQFDIKGVYDSATLLYVCRDNNNEGSPRELTVYGSNTADGKYVKLGSMPVQFAPRTEQKGSFDIAGYRYLRVFASQKKENVDWWTAAELNVLVQEEANPTAAYLATNSKITGIHAAMSTDLDALETVCINNENAHKDITKATSNYSLLGTRINNLKLFVLNKAEKGKVQTETEKPAAKWLAKPDYANFAVNYKTQLTDQIEDKYNLNELAGKAWTETITAQDGAVAAFENAVTTNANNYVAAMGQYPGVKNKVDGKEAYTDSEGNEHEAILPLADWLAQTAMTPALEEWQADKGYGTKYESTKKYSEMAGEMASIVADIRTAFENTTVTPTTCGDRITNLAKGVDKFIAAVELNETNHNAQLKNAEEAIRRILAAEQGIAAENYSEEVTFDFVLTVGEKTEHKTMTLAEINEAINDIKKALTPKNNDVYNDYKALDSKTGNVYGELVAKAEAYQVAVGGAYKAAVMAKNEETRKAAMKVSGEGENAIYLDNELDEAYKAAVKLYAQVEEIKAGDTDDYQDFVTAMLASKDSEGKTFAEKYGHARLQQYYADIAAINADAETILNGAVAGESYQILDASAFQGIKDAVALKLDDIQGVEDPQVPGSKDGYTMLLKKAVDAQAQEYFNTKFQTASDNLDEQKGYMATAGMTPEQIATATTNAYGHLALAYGYVTKTTNNDGMAVGPSDYVLSGDVAVLHTKLDAALKELKDAKVDAVEVINGFWSTVYDNATNTLDKATTGYKARYNTAKGKALDADMEEIETSWSEAIETIEQLGTADLSEYTEASELAAFVGGDLNAAAGVVIEGGLKPMLDNFLAQAEQAVLNAEAAATKNQGNIAALNEFRTTTSQLKTEIDEMHENVGTLGLTVDEFAGIRTVAAHKAYKTLAGMLLDEKGDSITNAGETGVSQSINTQIQKVRTAINVAYADAYDTELAYLNRVLDAIKTKFNNDYAAGAAGYDFDVLDADIKAQETAIGALSTTKDAAALAAMVTIEGHLFEIYPNDITANEDASGVAKTDLLEAASEVEAALDEAADALDALKADLATIDSSTELETETIAEKLSKVQSAIEKSTCVETSKGYFDDEIRNLAQDVATLKTSIADEQAVATNIINSNANYAKLSSELEDLAGYLDQIVLVVNGYEKFADKADYTETQAEKIRAMITAEQAKLDTAKETDSCAGMTISEDIETSINTLVETATKEETLGWMTEANTEYGKAYSAVMGSQHVNQAELEATLAAIEEEAEIMQETGNKELANETIEAANSVIEHSKALVLAANTSVLRPGDLDGNGKVTTADFVKMIDIILENSTVADIAELSGMSEEAVVSVADLNGDQTIGIGDAVMLLRMINRVDVVAAAKLAPARNAAACSTTLAQGKLMLDNNFTVASLMVDLQGVSASDVTLTSRSAGMEMMTNTLADGTVRVLVIAADGTMLEGNEGAVLNIAGKAVVTKAVVADARGTEYVMVNNAADATVIDQIMAAAKNAGQKVYNVSGQMVNGLKKGINIIRNTDGTATKVLKK